MDTPIVAAILLIAGAAMMLGARQLRKGVASPTSEPARWLHVAGRGFALGAAVVLVFEAASSLGLT